MKKSLFILSALAAAATGAQAQSSVTLAGTVDLAAQHVRRPGNANGDRLTHMVSGANSTSKLIFRGVEDLGGGMYANFWLEAGILADTGLGQATNTNNMASGTSTAGAGQQGLTFLRRSIVGLGGRWGEIQMGRNWNANYELFTGKYDPFAISVVVGLNYDASTNRDVLRVSNSIAYLSPKFAGFGVNLYHFRGDETGATQNGKGNGIRVMYDQGPFGAVAHYVRQRLAADDATYRGVGVVYDFRFAKLSAIYNRDDNTGGFDSRGWLIGGWLPVGAGEIKASFSTHRRDTGPRARKLALGYVHNLSKRTAIYTSVGHVRNRSGGTFGVANGGTYAVGANERTTGFDLGVRHNF